MHLFGEQPGRHLHGRLLEERIGLLTVGPQQIVHGPPQSLVTLTGANYVSLALSIGKFEHAGDDLERTPLVFNGHGGCPPFP